MNTPMNGMTSNLKTTRSSNNNYHSCKPSPVKNTGNFNASKYTGNNNNGRYYSKSESTSPSWHNNNGNGYQQRISPTNKMNRASNSWSNNGSVSPQKRYSVTQQHSPSSRHSPNSSDDLSSAVPNPFSTAKGYNDPPPAEILPMPPTKWTTPVSNVKTTLSSATSNTQQPIYNLQSLNTCKIMPMLYASPSMSNSIAIKA